jgi:hypothetical protein
VLGVLSRTKARLAPIPSLDQIPSPMRSRDPRPLLPHPPLSTNSLSRSSFSPGHQSTQSPPPVGTLGILLGQNQRPLA